MSCIKTILLAGIMALALLPAGKAQQKFSIGIIGSSTAYGYFGNPPLWPADSSYANRLKKFYQDRGVIDTLYNISEPSTNIYNAMPGWYSSTLYGGSTTFQPDSTLNITRILSKHPSVVLVHYPTNNYDALTTAEVMFAFRTVKAAADSAGIPAYILSTQPRGNISAAEHDHLLEIRDSMKIQFGNYLIDYYDSVAASPGSIYMNPALWLDGDSVHMNPAGHAIIYRQILAKGIFPVTAALPTKVNAFSVIHEQRQNHLQWNVQEESGTRAYEIWRSGNGLDFNQLATVSAIHAGGPHVYVSMDASPLTGWNYYKIAVISLDGNKTFTPIISISDKGAALALHKIYQQGPALSVEIQSDQSRKVYYDILSAQGSLLRHGLLPLSGGTTTQSIAVGSLPRAGYILRLTAAGQPAQSQWFMAR